MVMSPSGDEEIKVDIDVKYIIETRESVAAGEYAGSFNSYAQALEAAKTWRKFQGVCYSIRPRILPTLHVVRNGQGLQFVGGTF